MAERRLVSVLFADLVGFTTLSETRDSEEVRDLLTRYFDTCRTLITRYGGTVEKFIGDAVMAVWGTPVAQEDDAERAVRAALDLTEAVTAMGQEVGATNLRARAGVLTGEAAVTIGAEGQGMVAGDLVNTASRIQSGAPPGAVYVGETTRRTTDSAIVYEDAGSHDLKGKAEPMHLWRALRVIAGVGGSMRSAGLEAPFVGRDRELRMLKELFHSSADEGKAHLVSVIGIGGIGKSRLSWEFFKYIDGLAGSVRWHRGRCLSYGEGVTYWALAEMVRTRTGIIEGEDQASALAKLHGALEENLPDPEERSWVEPRLAHLLGLEDRVARDREDLFAAWRLFYERLAQEMPTCLVFEDMQWADSSLFDFIEYLLDWSRNYPLFVVTLARPELAEKRPGWGVGSRNFTSLFLEPLGPEAMDELLSGLAPGLPQDLRAQILERAEGVPLYAMETVRMLIDRGLLVQEGSSYRPTDQIEALEVPETLHALIAARLDGLSAEERRVVQDASVLGKTYTKQALASVSELPEPELEPILASLVRKEVLSLQADPRSPERGQYGFLQDLVKRVAYETLSKRDRKARHLAVAAYLETAWGTEEEEIVEVVASHYLEAFRAAPEATDAGDIRVRARGMLVRAAERAASLAASEEALRYFEQALELADEPLERAELHERAGRMAWIAGRAPEARAHFEQAISTFVSIGLSHPAARVSAQLGEVDFQGGNLDEAIGRMEEAFAILSADEPDEDLATLAAQLARLLYFSGRRDAAAERVEFALDIAEALRLPAVLAQALNTKALILKSRGRIQEAIALLEKALQVALEDDLADVAWRAYTNLGAVLAEQDRFEESLKLSEAGLELTRRVGNRVGELRALAGAISLYAYAGRWDETLARSDEILGGEDIEALQGVAIELLGAAPVLAHRGELERARVVLAVLPDGGSSQDVQTRTVYWAQAAPVLRAEGRLQEALAAGLEAYGGRNEMGPAQPDVKDGLVQAIEASFDLGDLATVEELLGAIEAMRPGELTPFLQAHGARLGARLAATRGQDEGVEGGFQAAAQLFRDLPMPFWLAVTLLEHGEWLASSGRGADAPPLLDEARKIFEDLRAAPWLERLGTTALAPAQASAARVPS